MESTSNEQLPANRMESDLKKNRRIREALRLASDNPGAIVDTGRRMNGYNVNRTTRTTKVKVDEDGGVVVEQVGDGYVQSDRHSELSRNPAYKKADEELRNLGYNEHEVKKLLDLASDQPGTETKYKDCIVVFELPHSYHIKHS